MARTIADIGDALDVSRSSRPNLPDDPGVLKAALASAQEARKVAEAERDRAVVERTNAERQSREALEHCARLTLMAGTLCRRILGDGGDLGGLEAELRRLGIEWTERPAPREPAPGRPAL